MHSRSLVRFINNQCCFFHIQLDLIDRRHHIKQLITLLKLWSKRSFEELAQILPCLFIAVAVYQRIHLCDHILGILEIIPPAVVHFQIPALRFDFFQNLFVLVHVQARRAEVPQNIRVVKALEPVCSLI